MRRIRRRRPLVCLGLATALAAGCTGGAGTDQGPGDGPTAPGATSGPAATPGIGFARGDGWEVTLLRAGSEPELTPQEHSGSSEPLRPEPGFAFLVVDAEFRILDPSPGEETDFSTDDVSLVGGEGLAYPVHGFGEERFCIECSLDLSTEDETVPLSLVFTLPVEEGGQEFAFRFRDLDPIPVSFGEIAIPAPSPVATGRVHTSNLQLVASLPDDGKGLARDFATSDLAFWGDLAIVGSYDGFRVLDISDPADPTVLSDVTCRSRQGDVSIWEDLVFVSADTPVTSRGCDGIDTTASDDDAFEGIRIFDVSDPSAPEFVTAVATDCGSHTHTIVPDDTNGRVLLYVSSAAANEDGLGPNCGNPHARISVVEVPLEAPQDASVVAEPALVGTPVHRWPDLGPGGPDLHLVDSSGCHDISVFLDLEIAAAACMSEGQLWDVSDPVRPRVIAHIDVPEVEFWHSAAFTWDGEIVVFGDEAFFGERGCRDPSVGGLWFFRVSDPSEPLAHLSVQREQGDAWPCSYHNFNVLPVSGRYVLVGAAYAAGTSVVDFTDPANPREIGFYDALKPQPASSWSSYWYNGFVYATDLEDRGLDVFEFTGAEAAGAETLHHLNPQTQERLVG